MDWKQALAHGAHAVWSRKTAATGIKGMAALAVGRWLWSKWQSRSQTGGGAETEATSAENRETLARPVEPRAM